MKKRAGNSSGNSVWRSGKTDNLTTLNHEAAGCVSDSSASSYGRSFYCVLGPEERVRHMFWGLREMRTTALMGNTLIYPVTPYSVNLKGRFKGS